MSRQGSPSRDNVGGENKLMFDALMGEMKRILGGELEQIHERMDKMEQSRGLTGSASTGRRHQRLPRRGVRVEEEEDTDLGESNSVRERGNTQRRDSNLGSIKMKIPSFQGKNDPELYLEWERKVDHIFECHNYSEDKKIKLAAVEFTDY